MDQSHLKSLVSEDLDQCPSQSGSDSSYCIDEDPKSSVNSQKSSPEVSPVRHKGKLGSKYAKISNEQRQKLINTVSNTGCTIKKAAKELNINFSTAKAIMQIYRREGRSTKKISRNERIRSFLKATENNEIQDKLLNLKSKGTQCEKSEDNDLCLQIEVQNRKQALQIQQLNAQKIDLQNMINQLTLEKNQMASKYQYLQSHYQQLYQMVMSSRQIQWNTFPPASK